MLPLQFDPALILSGLPRPAGSQAMAFASLTPGETVQATVVDVLDDGLLEVLVKGLRLQASSLVGRLPVGQVFDAQVESREGQILLRLNQPVPARLGPAEPVASGKPGQPDGLPLVAMLRTLLPADGPLSDGIRRLDASLSQAVEGGQLPRPVLAEFENLRRLILLEGQQGGAALPPARIQEALSSLGLSHEGELLDHVIGQGYIPSRSVENLKEWLIGLLAPPATAGVRSLPAVVISSSPSTPSASSISADPSPPALPASLQGKGYLEPSASAPGPAQPAAPGEGPGKSPVGKVAEDTASPSLPFFPLSRQGNETAKPVLPLERATGPEMPLESESEPVRGQSISSPVKEAARSQTLQAAPAPETESVERPEPAPASADHDDSKFPSAAPLPSRPASGQAVAAQRPVGLLAASPAIVAETAEAPAAPTREPAWVRDAQQMLAVLERTQALASLNVQSGQPFYFDLPLAWGGQGQARIYVEPRDSGAREDPQQPRSYNVVTLLELDGLGTVRVDTLLTGKRLSARFLLGQPAVERAVAGLLPALTRSLSAKGYHVDLVTSGMAEASCLRGDDLRIKAAPKMNLVNVKV